VKTDVALHTGEQTYISLYTGGGGLDLGFRSANPDAVPLLYVERELPAAALVVDHIKAGLLDEAPVWADTGTLDCRPFAGKVDWIIGGFPCQPFSYAGNRKGTNDERWLWEHIRRLASEIRPRYLFLENTPGVLVRDGIGTVLGELSEIGFDAEWVCVRASDVGAPHRRERVFILAYSTRDGEQGSYRQTGRERGRGVRLPSKQLGNAKHDGLSASEEPRGTGQGVLDGQEGKVSSEQPERSSERSRGSSRVAHAVDTGIPASRNGSEREGSTRTEGREDRPQSEPRGSSEQLANPVSQRGRGWNTGGEYAEHAFPPGPSASAEWKDILSRRPDLAPAVESKVRGVADGSSRTLARTPLFRILGNSVVPTQAHYAFQLLTRRIHGSATTSK